MKTLVCLNLLALAAVTPVHAAVVQAPIDKLPNGVVLVARPDRTSPVVAFSLLLRAGAADESPEIAGWRRLAVNAMLRSAPKGYAPADAKDDDADSLPRAAEKAGGHIGATVGADFVEIYGVGDSSRSQELLSLGLALIREPRMSDSDIDGARARLIEQVQNGEADPATKTEAALRGRLYRNARGELVAYGLPEGGTEASLRALTNDQVRDLVQKRLRPAELVVGAVGDVDTAAIRPLLEAIPATHSIPPATPYFEPTKAKQPALVVREFPTPVAWVFVSYALLGARPQDTPALRVLTSALGDSGRARLPARLLGKDLVSDPNAAVSVAVQFTPRSYAGELTVYAQTGPQGVEKVKNTLLDELRKLRDTPLSPIELQSAKNYLRGTWPVERDGLRERAFQTALSPALGGPTDTAWPGLVQAVTAADVQRVAKKYLNEYAVALVMPQN